MARQARRNARGKGEQAAPTGSDLIVIRTEGFARTFDATKAEVQKALQKLAHEWTYILRVRTRWSGDPDMRDYFDQTDYGQGMRIDDGSNAGSLHAGSGAAEELGVRVVYPQGLYYARGVEVA